MRLSEKVEECRTQHPPYTSNEGAPFGAFLIPYRSVHLKVMACDGKETGWDHVSVSLPNRCPNWEEMCFIKSLFFGEDETVIQFHPKASEYVNVHPHCLHLWKKFGVDAELPPRSFV